MIRRIRIRGAANQLDSRKEENAAWLALLKKLASPAAGTATARL